MTTAETAAAPAPDAPKKRYRAFISYSHKDRAFGRWLHNRLETYRFPKDKIGQTSERGVVPARLGRVFRDEWELGAADSLASTIEDALGDAQDLIVICTPAAAKSTWVDKEIRYFKANRANGQVFAVIVEGSPDSNDPETECFPPALKVAVGKDMELLPDQREDPLASDVVKDGREVAAIRLISGLSGLSYDDLHSREAERVRRQRRQAALTMAAALVLIALAGVGLTLAGVQTWRNEVSRADLLAAEAERALQDNEIDKAILLLLAAAPAREGHFGPGFDESPHTEVLLAEAAFAYRLERDAQMARRDTGWLQYRDGVLTVLQHDAIGATDTFTWRAISGDEPASRWSSGGEPFEQMSLGRSGGPFVFLRPGGMQLRDPRTGRAGPLMPLRSDVSSAALSSNGRYIAIHEQDERLLVFRTNDDLSAEKLFDHPLPVRSSEAVEISDDGAYALVYDMTSWSCIPVQGGARFAQTPPIPESLFSRSAAFADLPYSETTGPTLAITDERLNIQIRTCSGELKATLEFQATPLFAPHVQFAPDGRALLASFADHAQLFDIAGLVDGYAFGGARPPIATFRGSARSNGVNIFSPDSAHIAALGGLGRLRIWDARNGESLGVAPGAGKTYEMVASADGNGVALVHAVDGVFSLKRGGPLRRVGDMPACTIPEGCAFRFVIPIDGGRRVLVRRNDGWLGAIDLDTAAATPFADLPRYVLSVSAAANGTVAVFYADAPMARGRTMTLRDLNTGARSGADVQFDFVARAISPDGRLVAGLAEVQRTSSLVVANATTGARLDEITIRDGPIATQAFARSIPQFEFTRDGANIVGSETGVPFHVSVHRDDGGVRLERVAAVPAYRAPGPLWVINAGVADPGSGRSITPTILEQQQLTANYPPTLSLSPDARTLFALEGDRSVRAYELPPRGQALIEYACDRISADRAAFTSEEMKEYSLLRPDDQRPCERMGPLSPAWWLGLIGLR